MFATSNNCRRAASYEDCVKLFAAVPANTRAAGWNENNRPLDNIRKHHMRVERCRDGDHFDVVLYHTVMARFFRPANGEHVVWYNLDPRQTSKQFTSNVLMHSERKQYRTTDGRMVNVGLYSEASGSFPVKLTFVDGRLDAARSTDAPNPLAPTTSPERKAQRKAFRAWLRPYQAMATIMEGRYMYCDWRTVISAFCSGIEFDPTDLAMALKYKGEKFVVNACYPLGDVLHYEPSFWEKQ